jgi:outer membrane protein assembly factor BamB
MKLIVASGLLAVALAACGSEAPSASKPTTQPPNTVADWSRASDWTTDGANADRTGYVPVTIDPTVFKKAWSVAGSMKPTATVPGSVIVRMSEGGAGVVDAQTGVLKWSRTLDPNVGLWGASNPVAADSSIYVILSVSGSGTFFWRLLQRDGSGPLRVTSGSLAHWGAPIVVGQTVIAAASSPTKGIFAFDRTSGALRFQSSASNSENPWLPAVHAGRIVSFGVGESAGLTEIDAATGDSILRRTDPRLLFATSTVVTASGRVVGSDRTGRLVAADLATGSVIWEEPGRYGVKPLAANGSVFASGQTRIDVFNEGNGSLQWSWSVPADEALQAAEIVTDNLLFVWTLRGNAGATHAIDLASHREVWNYPAGGPMILSPDGLLLIGGSELVAITAR